MTTPESSTATAEALFFAANAHWVARELAQAEASFREAIGLVPAFAEAHANLALLLDQSGNKVEAEEHYRLALDCNPECVQTQLNFGAMLAQQKRFAEAEHAYRRALALRPDSAVAWSNLGVLQACCKDEAAAETSYRRAIALDADYALARFNFSYLLLRQGRFDEGWACLEARDWYAPLERHLTCPRWRGEDLDGKSILIGFEAGHGDMIQFCRYAALLKERGAARVDLLCHPGLKTLFATLAAVDQLIGLDDELPATDWDYWTPPMSIPFHCRTRLETIPVSLPYLHADPEKAARWAALLQLADVDGAASGRRELRVGLVWKGNPHFENDVERSLPGLPLLAALGSLAGVRFVSLQRGAGEDEAADPPAGLHLMNLGPQLADFSATAAVIANLDLVISVDTAVAHLAGAMGKPCWLLLPDYKTDWRWLTGRSDSPWYPGVMRLFRQPAGGGWGPVIDEVRHALAALVAPR
ncbi:tetratricopeptide repeat protein [Rhodocyclus tenuis]|uniref:Tetratricopeptide (TPR) repeat protein n=1 Tax=Rhodocyclus tenuis TaxID=1066 RepID=A0A840GAM1_RHOTE|nr:tetratricopeptide repeat protein [Rhodocyclus tenuis]MBB4248521.1 tetratricopeptide (TPR) repeat protein [Rhodocyclus tenuis]